MAEVNKVGSSSVQPTQSKSSSQQATKTQENSKVQQTTETQKPEDKDKTKETQKPEDKDKTEKDPEKEKLQEEIEKLKKELEELKKKLEESKNNGNCSNSAPQQAQAPQQIQNPQNPNDPNQLIIQDITAVVEAQKNGGQNLQQAVNKLKQDYSMIKSMGIQLKPEVDTLAQQIIQQFSGGNIQNPQIATGLNQAQTVNPTQNLQSSQFNNIV